MTHDERSQERDLVIMRELGSISARLEGLQKDVSEVKTDAKEVQRMIIKMGNVLTQHKTYFAIIGAAVSLLGGFTLDAVHGIEIASALGGVPAGALALKLAITKLLGG